MDLTAILTPIRGAVANLLDQIDQELAKQEGITPEAIINGGQDAAAGRQKIGLKDAVDKKLAVGDRVEFVGSDRFGNAQGTVLGADAGRVIIDVDLDTSTKVGDAPDYAKDEMRDFLAHAPYTASCGRVTRIAKATA